MSVASDIREGKEGEASSEIQVPVTPPARKEIIISPSTRIVHAEGIKVSSSSPKLTSALTRSSQCTRCTRLNQECVRSREYRPCVTCKQKRVKCDILSPERAKEGKRKANERGDRLIFKKGQIRPLKRTRFAEASESGIAQQESQCVHPFLRQLH